MAVKKSSRRSAHRKNSIKSVICSACEPLEPRRLFAVTNIATIQPVLAHPGSPASDTLNLQNYFEDPAIGTGNTVVTFDTVEGDITVSLTDQATPQTVANFLTYVNSGAYSNTFFHRSAVLSTGAGGSPTTPGDIIQGGGYTVENNGISHIATNAPVPDEYTSELFGDVAGTLAMAKTSMANSATSEFYFNVNDNSQDLDTPTTDSNGVTTSYTAFGTVLGNGMSVVDAIASLPTVDLSNVNSALGTLPVGGIPESEIATASISANNLVFINSVKVVPALTYTVTSDNPTLVQPTDNGNSLSFTYGAHMSGTAEITLTANSADGVSTISQTFAVTVPDVNNPTQGPTANPDTSSNIVTGTSGVVHPLANDTDSQAALLLTSVNITTPPANGTATVDPTTGYITYTPNANYVGVDTLQYTVTDTAHQISSPGTVSLDVVPAPIQLTIGTPAARTLTYTQPDGTVAQVIIKNGTAVVTFASFQVQLNTVAGNVTASGAGASITSIVLTNTGKAPAAFTETATGGIASLTSFTDAGHMSVFYAPNTALTGTVTIAGLTGKFVVNSATNSTITLGSDHPSLVSINTASNTNFSNGGGEINVFETTQWLDPQSTNTITAANIFNLICPGEFDPSITLTNSKLGAFNANVGKVNGGTWTVPGVVGLVKAQSMTSAFTLSTQNYLVNLKVTGDIASTIEAGAIGNLSAGSLTGAIVQTQATYRKGFSQINKLTIAGAISQSKIVAAGNIGTITAAALTDSNIDAGVGSADVQGGSLPTAASDLSEPAATIKSVSLGKTGKFSDSNIAAGILNLIQLGTVTTSNSLTPFGVAGKIINSLTAILDSGAILALTKTQTKTQAALTAYLTAKGAVMNDFEINVLT